MFLLFGMIVYLVVGVYVIALVCRGCIKLGRLLGWVVEILVSLMAKVRFGIETLMFQMVV